MSKRAREFMESGVYVGQGKNWMAALSGEPIPTTVSEESDNTTTISISKEYKYVNWGDDNTKPFTVRNAVKNTSVLGSGLPQKIKVHYGRGLRVLQEETTDNGQTQMKPLIDTDIQEFFKLNFIPKFQLDQITEYEFFQIAFAEYILSNDGNKVVRLSSKSAPFIRLSQKELVKINNTSSIWMSKKALYSKVWLDETPTKENGVEIDYIEPTMSVEEVREYCKTNKILKFIRPIVWATPATDYYPEAFWHAAIESGWVDLAQLIPKVKTAIIQNSMTLKYIVKIPLNYFKLKYPDDKYTPQQREALIEEDLTSLDEFLADYKNTGKNLVTYYDIDKVTKQKSGEWDISVIDNKIKDGVLNLDSAAANSEILFALGVPPTLVGSGMPGSSLGGNSGSDKRETYNVAVSNAMTDRMISLDHLYFIRDYNGWNENARFAYEDNILTTLDANPTGMQKQSV